MTHGATPDVFRDVDGAAASEVATEYLDRVAATPAARAYKEATIARLAVAPGASVADIGCGAGADLPTLSRAVGPGGRVVGVDLSAALAAVARARAAHCGNVDAMVADAHDLPFADDELDAARVDRVLLHVERPQTVVRELARSVRPGGRVVVSEGDWGTLVVAPGDADVVPRMFDPLAAGIRHPLAGRHAAAMMAAAGLDVLSVEPVTAVFRTLDEADALLQLVAMADGAVARVDVAITERDRWLCEAREASERGSFLAALTGFIVVGVAA